MSRLAKKAQQEQSKRAQARPYIIGIGSALVLLAAIFVTGLWQPETTRPELEITAGRIHVEGVDALVDALPSRSEKEVAETPVHFYELLGTDDIAGQPEALVMRDLPLPPPPGEEPVLFPVPEPDPVTPKPEPVSGPESMPESQPETMAAGTPGGVSSIVHGTAPAMPELQEIAPVVVAEANPEETTSEDVVPAVMEPLIEAQAEVADEPKPYTLQVASFSQSARAEELMSRLAKAGHDAYLVPVDLGAKGLWWRVRVGHFPNEHAAKWARLDLVKLGVSPIVVRDPDVR